MTDHITMMSAIEQAVHRVFDRRFGGRLMSYEQTRELVFLERDVVENIACAISEYVDVRE